MQPENLELKKDINSDFSRHSIPNFCIRGDKKYLKNTYEVQNTKSLEYARSCWEGDLATQPLPQFKRDMKQHPGFEH